MRAVSLKWPGPRVIHRFKRDHSFWEETLGEQPPNCGTQNGPCMPCRLRAQPLSLTSGRSGLWMITSASMMRTKSSVTLVLASQSTSPRGLLKGR